MKPTDQFILIYNYFLTYLGLIKMANRHHFKCILWKEMFCIFYIISLRLIPVGLVDNLRAHQETRDYLIQCWPISVPPYDITRPQWVKSWNKIFKTKLFILIDHQQTFPVRSLHIPWLSIFHPTIGFQIILWLIDSWSDWFYILFS